MLIPAFALSVLARNRSHPLYLNTRFLAVARREINTLSRFAVGSVGKGCEYLGIAFSQLCREGAFNGVRVTLEDGPGNLCRQIALGAAARVTALPRLPRP